MPNFVPEGKIRIGRVPFDNSYRHTMTFDSAQAQTEYFSSVCPTALSRNDYTYVRTSNSIRVPFNAEQLYTYNYVMYQNANYGTKWFYAFIVGINYLNKATTELVLELDVMQTWYFDYTLTEGFVEREHVSDDTPGAHTVPEPATTINYVALNRNTIDLGQSMIVVQAAQGPDFSLPDWASAMAPSIPVTGGWYDNVFSGCKYYGFKDTEQGRADALAFFMIMNLSGSGEAISSVFVAPENLLPVYRSDSRDFTTDTSPVVNNIAVEMPSSLGGGYVPRNNKLFTYPYCYCLIDDNNGNSIEYRYEYWEKTGAERRFHIVSNIGPDAKALLIPQNYDGIEDNVTEAFRFNVTVQCSWIYSAYQTWLAQNGLANAFSAVTSALPFASSVGQSLADATMFTQESPRHLTNALGRHSTVAARDALYDVTMQEAAGTIGGAAVGAATGLVNSMLNVQRMSKVPNTTMGAASDSTLLANGYLTCNVTQMVPRREYAEMIDEFFDMYGYEVDRVKVPNRTGRPNWNYVKMRNSCHRGNVPAQDMAQINAIYDSGITFWHTSDVGNYSLPNGA